MPPDVPNSPLDIRTHAVDLVDEEDRRYVESAERTVQDDRLRLNAFDGRDHQHGTIENR